MQHTKALEMEKQRVTKKKLNLLGHIEKIVELSEKSKLSDDFFQLASEHLLFVKNVLPISDTAIVLLAILLDSSDNSHIRMADIARHLGLRKLSLLQQNEHFKELEKCQLIKHKKAKNNESFSVPDKTIKALTEGRNIEQIDFSTFTTDCFFAHINELFEDKHQQEIDFNDLTEELSDMLAATTHLEISSKILKMKLDANDLNLFFAFLQVVVNESFDYVTNHHLNDIFNYDYQYRAIINALKKEKSRLQVDGWIEPVNNDGMMNIAQFRLTEKTKTTMLSELDMSEETKPDKRLLLSAILEKKSMFYNDKERRQIEQLTDLLQQENFQTIQQRLQEQGMRKGFACLFYGAPGTGKTETVYQIAKNTGRDILPVNVTEIKSKWVGESEQNIKGMFDYYKELLKKMDKAPILLFNEADAVLGIRTKPRHAVDKMENALQNIILQEMEDFEGIMIATTNLTKNLDSAFERRFLYKIEFQKPNLTAKKSIWNVMIPILSAKQIGALASKYDFSGGQIENVARKCTVEHILTGKKPSTEILFRFCDSEMMNNSVIRRKVGFV